MNKSLKKIYFISIIIYVIIFVLSLFIGRYFIGINDLFNNSLINFELEKNIIYNLRLPRAIVASLAGISLSLSGLVYQEIFQNDLVSPDLLGVSNGASVGAAISIVFSLSNFFIAFISFSFGILTVLLTVLISNIFNNKNNITLILSGIIVGSFMSSILAAIKYFVNPETQLSTIVYWLMGSFANATYNNIIFMFPIVLIFLIVLLLISHRINVVALGKEEAETKGINYILYRNIIIASATILTSTTVAFCGTISWIGLIIPHIVKLLAGKDVNKTIPLCAIFGAIFTLIADIISRTLVQSEIPISAITGIFGSMIFTIILIRHYKYRDSYKIKKDSTEINDNCKSKMNINCIKNIKSSDEIFIKFENVYFRYSVKTCYVLKNISLDIKKHSIFIVLGQNGSGKTTLLKILLGIIKPTSGNVFIGGKNINELSLKKLSKLISYVKQDFTTLNNFLVKDFLVLGMVNELKFYEKPTREQLDRVEKYADELNIKKLLYKKFNEISGGEKQLVSICQSLLQDAEVLVLDEPTSSLDSENQKLVIDIIMRLSKEYNKTVIFSTHNLAHKNIEGCSVLTINKLQY